MAHINLHYCRAAIEDATGIRLSLEKTRQYLIEEGLITQAQADKYATIFKSYDEFFDIIEEGIDPDFDDLIDTD